MSDSMSTNQIGGYKATLSNPNVSDEAKKKARDVLDSAGISEERGAATSDSLTSNSGQNTNRVMGGYKATLSNPNTSDEAKAKAEQVLQGET